MDMTAVLQALFGGVLIGFAAVGLMLANGRISGISGIFGGALAGSDEGGWRWWFVAGLLAGGGVLWMIGPEMLPVDYEVSGYNWWLLLLGGLLVGFGTRLGSGCTSGHGVCGVSRLSPRSMVATVTFMVAGMAAVYFTRGVMGW